MPSASIVPEYFVHDESLFATGPHLLYRKLGIGHSNEKIKCRIRTKEIDIMGKSYHSLATNKPSCIHFH